MKRIFAIVLCLLMFCVPAFAEICVRMDEGALLLSRDGSEIIPIGTYDDIVPVTGKIYAAGQNGLYALMDAGGALLSDFGYTFVESAGNALIAESSGMWGLLSPEGIPLTGFEYTRILPTGDGRFWAIRDDGDDLVSDELFILDADGTETATGLFVRRIQSAGSNGLLAVMRPASGFWGYCDTEGEMVIPARFSYAGTFLHGIAPVVENGLYGAISADGRTIIAPEYDYLEICSGGFILAGLTRQGIWVFDLNGREINHYEDEETFAAPLGEGYILYESDAVTLYNADGEILSRIGQGVSAYEGLNGQIILADGAWGEACVGILGTQNRYQNLYPLGYAKEKPVYACMEANSARYINDLLGEVQLSVDMESARYGIVSSAGEILIPAQFQSITSLGDDRFLTRAGEYYQMIDTAGNVYWTHGLMQTEAPIS